MSHSQYDDGDYISPVGYDYASTGGCHAASLFISSPRDWAF